LIALKASDRVGEIVDAVQMVLGAVRTKSVA
jgi:hypothetical protein